MRAGIIGIGSSVPERVLTNSDLEKLVETSDGWIRTRTGIVERRIVGDNQTTSDLATAAGKRAIADAGIDSEEVALIVVATSSPDMIFPSTACLTQQKLGLSCPAFDVSAACAGFVFGLSTAALYVSSGTYRTVLFIGADALTRHVDWTDRSTCVLFGDAAGAVVLQPAEEGYGVLSTYLASDGTGADILKIPAGGSALPGTLESVREHLHCVQMKGNEVFKFAVKAIPNACDEVLARAGMTISEIDHFVAHQANRRIIEAAVERLGLSPDRVAMNIDRYGNTSTASIPLVVDELYREGRLHRGHNLLLVGFGAGLTWGANIVRWSK